MHDPSDMPLPVTIGAALAVSLGLVDGRTARQAMAGVHDGTTETLLEIMSQWGVVSPRTRRLLGEVTAMLVEGEDDALAQAILARSGLLAVRSAVTGRDAVAPLGETMGADEPAPAEVDDGARDTERVALPPMGATLDTGGVERYSFGPEGKAGAEVGRGGIGRVLVALDKKIGRRLAFKELLDERLDGSKAAKLALLRFIREACITGQLEHPSIVPVHDLGLDEEGVPFYTMKLVKGRDLRHALDEASSFDERLALLPHFVDLCHAIAYAHDRGVLHRDIKPDNVMVGQFGETLVLDWGIAKVIDEASDGPFELPTEDQPRLDLTGETDGAIVDLHGFSLGKTVAGVALGTPLYMSPERITQEGPMDEAGDLWSLGVVLHELVTGAHPCPAKTPGELFKMVVVEGIPPARQTATEAPQELAAMVDKALHQDHGQRYQSVQELIDDLEAYQAGRRVKAYEYSSWELVRRFAQKNRALVTAGGVVLVVILAALLMVSLAYDREMTARAAADTALTEANHNLAEALGEKAITLAQDEQTALAKVYAAASLVYNPANPKGPSFVASYAEATPEAHLLGAEALGLLYQASFETTGVPTVITAGDDILFKVAVSPDGGTIAAGSRDGTVLVTPLQGGPVTHLEGHSDAVVAVAFSPDGGTLASTGWDGAIRLWNTTTWAPGAVLTSHEGRVYGLAYLPDGALASAGWDGSIKLWDAKGAPVWSSDAGQGKLHAVAASDDGAILATAGDDGTIKLWSRASGDELALLLGHQGVVYDVAFAGRTTLVSGGDDETVRIWDITDKSAVAVLEGHDDRVFSVTASPDGALVASSSSDGTVRVWDVASALLVTTLAGHADRIFGVSFAGSPEWLVTSSWDTTIRTWQLVPGRPVTTLQGHTDRIYGLSWAATGDLVASSGGDGTVKVWDTTTGVLSWSSHLHDATVWSVAIAPDGATVASAGGDGTAKLWDAATGTVLQTLKGHDGWVSGVAFSPDGAMVASSGADGTVRLWSTSSGDPLCTLEGHTDTAWSVAFSPSKGLLASSGFDGTVRLWDPMGCSALGVLGGDLGFVSHVAFSPDGSLLAAAGKERIVRIWDVAGKEQIKLLEGHEQWVNRLVFTSDGGHLVSASDDRTVIVWDLATGDTEVVLSLPTEVNGIALDPTSGRIAIASDVTVQLLPLDYASFDADPVALLEAAQDAAKVTLHGFDLTSAVTP